MFRISLILAAELLLLSANGLSAQSATPSPRWVLHDVQHKVTAPPPPLEGKYSEVDGRRFVRIDPTSTRIWVLAFSQDGRYLAAGKDYGRIVIWDVAKRQVYCVIDTGTGGMKGVAISHDDQYIAASANGLTRITVWHIPDGKQVSSFAAGEMSVASMFFTHDPAVLVYSYSASTRSTMPNGTTVTTLTPAVDVVNPVTGNRIASFPSESWPVASNDGSTLMTESAGFVVLRSTSDWTEQKRLRKLTDFAHPVFLDLALGWYLFWDGTDDHRIVAARLSDGQMPPEAHLANLPQFSYLVPPFAAIAPRTGLVFGHGSGYLWVLDLKNGHTCLSPNQYTDGAALSPDGSLVAGAFDSPTATEDQEGAGVALWETASIAKSCHLK
jgi:WD40 repeat protein